MIFGASGAIRSSVALLTFEAGRGVQFLAPMVSSLSLSLSLSLLWYPPPSLTLTLTYAQVAEMDALGYSCYSTSRAGLFKYNGSPLLPAPPSPP